MSDQNSDKNKSNESPDRKLLEDYKAIADYAKSEISWVRSAYRLAVTLTAFVFAVGIFFTYKSSSDFRNEARQDMARQEQQLSNRLNETSQQMDRQEQQLSNRLTTLYTQMQDNLNQQVNKLGHAVEARVDEAFKQENIRSLVEDKARTRIDQIADPLIRKNISQSIMPQITSAENKLEKLHTELNDARNTITDLKAILEFNTTVISAQNDDRLAFDKLRSWADDIKYPRHAEALQAWIKILDDHASPFVMSGYTIPWKEGLDPSKLSLSELKAIFSSAQPFIKLGLLEYVWNRKDFKKRDRMEFFTDVIRTDTSLKILEAAARLFMQESKQKLKPLAVAELLKWWEKNKDHIDNEQR